MYRGQAEEGLRPDAAYQRLQDDQYARPVSRFPGYPSRGRVLDDEPQPIRAHDLSRHNVIRARAEENGSLVPIKALSRERAQGQDLVIRTRRTVLDPRSSSSERSSSSSSTKSRKPKRKGKDSKASSSAAAKKKPDVVTKLDKHGGIAGLVLVGAAGIAGLTLLNKARHRYYDDPLESRKHLMDSRGPSPPDDDHRHDLKDAVDSVHSTHGPGYEHDDDFHRELEKSHVYNVQEHRRYGSDETSYASDTATMSSLASSIDERRIQRLKGKQQRMTGFALIATVNATNRMYQGANKRRQRRQALADGTMTPEEAKKKKTMDGIQNAASIIAAGASIRAAMMKSREAKSLRQERADYHKKKADYVELKAEHDARALERRRSAHSTPQSTPQTSPQSRSFD